MNEEIIEKIAQLQHENTKLLDELDHLKEHTLLTEEALNTKCLELTAEKKRTKSLEQQNNSANQAIQEKDHLIDLLEQDKINYKQLQTKLSSENLSLKTELLQEKTKNKELEIFKTELEDLQIALSKVQEDNQRLISELSQKSQECFTSASNIKDLLLQIKELENEKTELLTMRDTLLQEKEDRQKSSENLECLLRKSPAWSKSPSNLFGQDVATSCNKESSLNLREELLEVELQEKQILIRELEFSLRKKEEEESERNKLATELKKALSNAGLLDYDLKENLKASSSGFYDIYNHLLKLINWPEGQPTECKPLTDVPVSSVIVKDGVQTTQPSSDRIVEMISIASQTDPIKNLSPVLPFKSFEKLQTSFCSSPSRSDSDEEGDDPLSFIEKNRIQKDLQLFAEHKNCDLDMDMYRSCRKLSVLPEEDFDESSNRKSSLKKSYNSSLNNFNLKTHSADDITKIKTVNSLPKATSCSSVTRTETCDREGFLKKENSREIATNLKSNDGPDDDLQLAILSPKDAFRQPHSFDSYLDPLKMPSSPLPRQASDPTQNTVFAPPITRRGSYIRRPRSTFRPLTLPCGKNERRKEERICKVRFDLGANVGKRDENAVGEEVDSSNAKKIKLVSRFRVEVIDEDQFRKSLEENERAVTRKRPPLIHSVVYKKSMLRDFTNFDEVDGVPSVESPDSPVYDTATEDSPVDSFDGQENYPNESYPVKRRKQSDASSYSIEDSQSSSEGNDILIKSIKLHSNSKCIIMKDLQKENSDSSCSNADSEIPYIDAEDLPVIKSGPEAIKIIPVPEILFSEKNYPNVVSPTISEGSDTYLTPCDEPADSGFAPPKSSGLSKSPTVLKNLANFELLAAIGESRKSVPNEIIEEEQEEWEDNDGRKTSEDPHPPRSDSLKRTPSDVSEASESDTLTYGTVKSHMAASSDGDSDTYVTVWSDKSFGLERKFSDFSENSSSPYNTPPDTSSASFCTPPDTYSPVLNSVKKHLDKPQRSSDCFGERKREEFPESCRKFEKNEKYKSNFAIFDSPKLEFYETNDSVENLEAFLQTEEGLNETKPEEGAGDGLFFETEDFREALSKQNSLESPKPLERRKKHPPLSRQNSTEEYNFLDPHDSCLNLSEEMSSPSTTPDTSNKTVIFKSVPLTVSSTIDLDDDFPISDTEIQVNFNGSQTEIHEVKGEDNVRMSKRSESPVSDRLSDSSLDLSEGSSASDMESDNSRDVNLNSKKFADNNLLGGEVENSNNSNNNNISGKNEEDDLNLTSEIENLNATYCLGLSKNEGSEVQTEKLQLDVENTTELNNSNHLFGRRKISIPLTTSSTPKPEAAESQALFTISTETSPVEPDKENQTFTVAKTTLSQSASLSNEEIGRKFQDLSFAFKTDSMTIQKRLQLMKRRRDQAESNIENELGIIKAKLKSLQYLGLNSEYVNLMTELKNQLDFVLNATVQLSSSAEGYGYAQHEERLLELIGVMVQHVENVETSKMNSSKGSDKPKMDIQRLPSSVFLDSARDDDKILRRRSVVLRGDCRRRASIATLPRIGNAIENGGNGKGSQWSTPNRSSGGAAKKLLFPQTSPRSNIISLPGIDNSKDSGGARLRKDSRTSESSMSNIDESPEPRTSTETEVVKEPDETESNSVSDSSLQLKQLFESIEEVRRSSSAQEHITAGYCIRRILEWNKLLLSSARFRWPENVLHYSPFFITWYIVFVLALVFIGGFFTGINGCYHTYSCIKYPALWLAAPAFFSFTRRFYRFLLPLFLAFVFVLTVFFFWLTNVVLPQLTSEEVDSLFKTLGFEIRYLHGPPPV